MMLKKSLRKLGALLLCGALTLGCAAAEQAETVAQTFESGNYTVPFLTVESSDTILALQQPCEHQGTVVTLDYGCPAYAINEVMGKDVTLDKSVSVYLPYGYDAAKQYDVLYLLHGTGGDEAYWLVKEKTGVPTVNMLDNMIDQGLCQPLIIVTPNWNADKRGKEFKPTDEQLAAYAEKVNDPVIASRNDLWVVFFGQELREDIIPLVEMNYSTYAGGDASDESLCASRDHRALAGLSRGSMATLREGMIENLDLFSWFGAYSGAWTDFDAFKQAVESGAPIHYWYNGNGTEDFSLGNHTEFLNRVMSEMPGTFVDGENFAWIVKEGSAHTYENWLTDLYNTLLVFFTK